MDSLGSFVGWVEMAAGVTELALQWLVQSAIVVVAGLLAARLLRHRAPAVRSAVYRTTLVAALACPAVSYLLAAGGLTFFTLRLPPVRVATLIELPPLPAPPEPPVAVPANEIAVEPAAVLPAEPSAETTLEAERLADPAPVEFAPQPAAEFSPFDSGAATPIAAVAAEPAPPAVAIESVPEAPRTQLVMATQPVLAALVVGATIAWLAAACVLLARLVLEHWQLARIRRLAVPASDEMRQMLEELARQMRVPPPRLVRSPFVSSPCLAGIVRPTILLPEDLSTPALAAVLVHELAHLKRGDCLWNLLRHVSLAILCGQPLLWRLSRDMEAAAEEVCDDYVMQYGASPQDYAETLLTLAERNLLPASAAVVSLVTFRSLLSQRVRRVLDQSRRLSLVVGLAALSLIVAGGLSAVLLAGLVGPAGRTAAASEQDDAGAGENATDDENADDESSADEAEPAASEADGDATRQVTGQVLLPGGDKAAGADVVLLARRQGSFQRGKLDQSSEIEILGQTRCDADGRFELPADDLTATPYLWVQLLARTKDCGLAWHDVNADEREQNFTIQLLPASQARGRLVTSEGNGAAGIPIAVNRIGRLGNGTMDGVDSMRAELPVEVWPRDVVTDADGWFAVPGVAADCDLNLHIDQEPFATAWWMWKAADTEHVEVLSPSQIVTGVVVGADTGEPLPHAQLTVFQGWDPNRGGMMGIAGQADAKGRFRMNPHAAGSYTVSAFAPDGVPYLSRKMDFDWPATATEHEVRVELPRGVLLHGRVVDQNGEGVSGAHVRYEPRALNQNVTDDLVTGWQGGVISGADGRYAIAVPPGPGGLTVLCSGGQFVVQPTTQGTIRNGAPGGNRLYLHAHQTFNLAADAKDQLLDLPVTRGAKIAADVVGPDGAPPEQLLVAYGGMSAPYHDTFGHSARKLPGGALEIHSVPPEGELKVFLLDPIKKNGLVVMLRGQDSGRRQRIELAPCGTAKLRFVDLQGQPVAGANVWLNIVFTPGASPFGSSLFKPEADHTFAGNFDRRNHWMEQSGDGGWLTYEALIPGADYELFGTDENDKSIVERTFQVKPGEQKQLEDYVIRSQDVLDQAEANRLEAKKEQTAQADQAAANDESDDDLIVFRGRVVDPAGKPLAAARVAAVRWFYEDQLPGRTLAQASSDDAGNFEIAFRKSQFDRHRGNGEEWRRTLIAATAPGLGVGWIEYKDIKPGQGATIHLVEDQPITGRIVDLEGNPVAGATMRVDTVYHNEQEDLSTWIDALRDGISFAGSTSFGRPDEQLPTSSIGVGQPVRTDADGRFQIAGVGRHRFAMLKLAGPGIAVSELRVVTVPVDPFVMNFGDYTRKRTHPCYGSQFQHGAEPTQPYQGIVRDTQTGKPLAGVRVVADRLSGSGLNGVFAAETLSDSLGHYRLDGMPKGDGNRILAIPTDEQPYFMREFDAPTGPGLEPVALDLELHRGIWITGRLTEQGTGKPIHAQMHYVPWPDNPHIRNLPEFNSSHLHGPQMHYETDAQGRFKLPGLPGRGLVEAISSSRPYPTGQGLNAIADLPSQAEFNNVAGVFAPTEVFPTAVREINPANDEEAIDLDFRLDPGQRLKLRFVDPRGNPVSNLWIRGLWPPTPFYTAEGVGPEAEMLALGKDEQRLLIVIDNAHGLGKVVTLGPADAADGVATVTLEPLATVKARLLNQEGEPVRAATIRFEPDGQAGFSFTLPLASTDKDGVLNNTAVPGGARYHVHCHSTQVGYQTVAQELAVAAGETIDLGEFDVTAEERPEPKRSAAKPQPAKPAADAPAKPEGTQAVVRGRVVDPEGQAVAGADVWATYYAGQDDSRTLGQTKSDARGAFELRFAQPPRDPTTPEFVKTHIVARAAEYGPAWVVFNEPDDQQPLTLRLAADRPIEGRIVDLEGRPVAGAQVRVTAIGRNEKDDLAPWLDALRSGVTYRTASFVEADKYAAPNDHLTGAGPPLDDFACQSGADGTFRIAGLGSQRSVSLNVSGAGIVSTQLFVATVPTDSITVRFGNPEPFFDRDVTVHGAKFQFAAEPSPPITGRVVDAKTGQPLAGVSVVAKKFAGKRMSEYGQTPVISNEKGEYRLDGMPRGEGNLVLVTPGEGQPYFARELEVPKAESLDGVQFDIKLHRGVPIHGRVINKATGAPVEATVRYIPWPDNPHLKATEFQPRIYSPQYPKTDAQGRFELVGLPGQGLIYVECGTEPLPAGQGLEALSDTNRQAFSQLAGGPPLSETYPTAVHKVDVAEDAAEHATEIALEAGKSAELQVVDAAGQPLSGLNVRGLWPGATYYRGKDLPSPLQLRGLMPNQKRLVLVHQVERNLGGMITVDGEAAGDEPLRLTLQPCGTVQGQLLDEEGEPVRGAYVSIMIPRADNWMMDWAEATTDQQGRFRCDTLVPGTPYELSMASPQTNWQSVAKKLTVGAGETVDLGTFDVTAEKRPEPKRMPAGPKKADAAANDDASESSAENAMVVRGTVLDPDGKPLAGADVKLYRSGHATWAKDFPMPQAKSDQQGRFALELPKSRYDGVLKTKPWPFALILASAEGLAPAYAPYEADRAGTEPTIQLVANSPIEGRIVDLEGNPVPGVQVRVSDISTNVSSDPTEWLEAVRSGTPHAAVPETVRPNMGLSIDVDQPGNQTETDADGRFRITGVGRGRVATLTISGGGIVSTDVKVVNWPIETFTTNVASSGTIDRTFYGKNFQVAAEPAQPIEGVVRDAATGTPLAGVTIRGKRMAGKRWTPFAAPPAVSDEQGRYRLEGMPKGEGNRVLAAAPDGQPYFDCEFDVPTARDFETVTLDVELHRGTIVRGQVRDKLTGEPVQARLLYLPWPDNPHKQGLQEFNSRRLMWDEYRYISDDEGRFTIVGLPGRGLISVVRVDNRPYPPGQGFDLVPDLEANRLGFDEISQLFRPRAESTIAIKEIRPAEDQQEFTADIELVPGKTVKLRVVDEAGQPVSAVTTSGTWPNGMSHVELRSGPEVTAIGLHDDETRWVSCRQNDRNIARIVQVHVGDDADGPVPVVLQPCATITGRLVGEDRRPLEGVQLHFFIAGQGYGTAAPGPVRTEKDGRFVCTWISPGVAYDVTCEIAPSPQVRGPSLADNLAVEPGQTIDLGEIDITSNKRPTPKTTAAKLAETTSKPDAAEAADDDPLKFAGNVVDPTGKPVAGAKLYVIYYTPTPIETNPRAVTDAEGHFAFEMRKDEFDTGEMNAPWEGAQVIAVAPGFGPAWATTAGVETSGQIMRAHQANPNFKPRPEIISYDSTLRLVPDDVPIEGRVVDLEGQGLAGVELQVIELHGNLQNSLDAWLAVAEKKDADYYKAREQLWGGFSGLHMQHQVAQLFPKVVTDAEGRFRIAGIGRERIVMLRIAGPGIQTQQVFARTRSGPTLHLAQFRQNPGLGRYTYYGAHMDFAAAPSRDVVGVVRDRDTGNPVPLASVEAYQLAGQPLVGWTNAYIRTTADGQGRYRLSGLPLGENRIRAGAPAGDVHLPANLPVETKLEQESATVDFELKRGTWIRGRLTDAASGEPLRGWVEYFAFSDNPNLQDAGGLRGTELLKLSTDADGRFAIRALPGRGIVGVMAHHHDEYPRGAGAEQITARRDSESLANPDREMIVFRTEPSACISTNFHALKEVDAAEGLDELTLDFALAAGPQIEGTIVDPDGEPLAGAIFAGGTQLQTWGLPALKDATFVVRNLQPGKPRRLQFLHAERKLAGSVLLTGNETGPLTVKLEPWGTIKGRVFTRNGDPAEKVMLLGNVFSSKRLATPGLLPDPQEQSTDEDGYFEISGLAPGVPYALSGSKNMTILGTIVEQFQVAAGETKDLGELTLHQGRASDEKPAEEKAAANTQNRDRFELAGRVVDADGKPVAGAKIHLVGVGGKESELKPSAVTGPDGNYKFTIDPSQLDDSEYAWRRATLVAVAPGYGFSWTLAAAAETSGRALKEVQADPRFRLARHPDWMTDATLRLVADDAPIEGRVINLEGQPLAGAEVRVIALQAGAAGSLDAWLKAVDDGADYYEANRSLAYAGRDVLRFIPQPPATGADGRFRIQGIGRERIVELRIDVPGHETSKIYARTRPGEALYLGGNTDSPDPKLVYFGAQFDFAAAPSRAVVGVVRAKETGQPMAGVSVCSNHIAGHRVSGWSQRYLQATTDVEGRYRLEGLPIGSNELIAMPPDDQPYLCITAKVETTPAAQTATLDFELPRGVWIRGRVTDAATKQPLRARVEYFAFLTNPHLSPEGGRLRFEVPITRTDEDGRYQIVGLPGRGLITTMADNAADYPRGAGADKITEGRYQGPGMFRTSPYLAVAMNTNALVEVNPAPDAEAIEQDIVLHPGPKIEGTVLDPEGKPLAGAMYTSFGWERLDSATFLVRNHFPRGRRVYFYHEGRKLAGSLLVDGDEAGPLTVKLQPWGVLKGRVLTENGDPADNVSLSCPRSIEIDVDEINLGYLPRDQRTDTEGRFTIEGLAPGLIYNLRADKRGLILGDLVHGATVAAGETKDLGDLTIGSPADLSEQEPGAKKAPAPEAKASAARADEKLQFSGKVVDASGKSAPGAKVYLLQDVPQVTAPLLTTETKSDGSFAFTVAKSDFNRSEFTEPWRIAKVVATREGLGIAWALAASFDPSGEMAENLPLYPNSSTRDDEIATDRTLHLVADDVPINGRIVDLEGNPVAGARVRVIHVSGMKQGTLDAWLELAQDKERAFYEAWRQLEVFTGFNFYRQLEGLFGDIRTDADGRFQIRGVGRERLALLQIEGPGIETHQVSARTRAGKTFRIVDPRFADKKSHTYYPATFDHVAGPSRPVRGIVRDVDTGQPLAGVEVQAYRTNGNVQPYPNMMFYTVTGDDGRYELAGLPVGNDQLLAIAPGEPYLAAALPAEIDPAKAATTVDFELKRGVWLHGRITDSKSGQPIRGTVQYYTFLDNPRLREAPGFGDTFARGIPIDVRGRYQVAGLPGRGILGVRARNYSDYPVGVGAVEIDPRAGEKNFLFRTAPDFCTPTNHHTLVEVNPDENGQHTEYDVKLVPGPAVEGTVTDPDGQPLSGAMIFGITQAHVWQTLSDASFSVRNLQPGEPRRVQFYHEGRKLAGSVLVTSDEKGPLTVKLQPWATITGRAVNAQGDPLSEAQVVAAEYHDHRWGVLPKQHAFELDDEGRFEIAGLAPGTPYYFAVHQTSQRLGILIKDLELAAGETRDLGDLTTRRSND